MQSTGVAAVTAFTAHREWASRPPDERHADVSSLYEAARARRAHEERIVETNQIRTEAPTDGGLALRAVRRDRGAYALELRAARGHSRRAAEIPPNPAWVDRVERDQLRAGTAAPRRASALRGPRRTVDRPRGHLSEVRGSTMTSWQPGCSTSCPITRMAPAARIQGRRLRR